jgi:hypothetical protein
MSVPPLYLHAAVLPPYLLRSRQRFLCERRSTRPNWWRGSHSNLIRSSVDSSVGQAGLDTFILTSKGIYGCSTKPKVVRTGPTADLGISIRCEELCPAAYGG